MRACRRVNVRVVVVVVVVVGVCVHQNTRFS